MSSMLRDDLSMSDPYLSTQEVSSLAMTIASDGIVLMTNIVNVN